MIIGTSLAEGTWLLEGVHWQPRRRGVGNPLPGDGHVSCIHPQTFQFHSLAITLPCICIIEVSQMWTYIMCKNVIYMKFSKLFSYFRGESHFLFKGMGCSDEGPKMVRNVDIEPQKFVTYLSPK